MSKAQLLPERDYLLVYQSDGKAHYRHCRTLHNLYMLCVDDFGQTDDTRNAIFPNFGTDILYLLPTDPAHLPFPPQNLIARKISDS